MPESPTHIIRLVRGFTLAEAIASIAVLAIATASVVAMVRNSDNAALRARLEARASSVFGLQTDWVVGMPFSAFKFYAGTNGINVAFYGYTNASGPTNEFTASEQSQTNLIYPFSDDFGKGNKPEYENGFLLQNASILPSSQSSEPLFPYRIELTGSYDPSGGTEKYTVAAKMTFSMPALSKGSPAVTNTLNFSFDKYP